MKFFVSFFAKACSNSFSQFFPDFSFLCWKMAEMASTFNVGANVNHKRSRSVVLMLFNVKLNIKTINCCGTNIFNYCIKYFVY